ncbi:NAD-dependent malic enzyme [Candidatus Kaiserbacteria bacterium CG10_big_fil_rev_8_21_14_0_10_59_10]|uniref:NAD-dependent malic enzyme n=1 Tax=Candidatus Kaiserbacteria bacterium CG10_big_fil_rev_8_21_14_0_10_59_10 TaxID=1974612 RepID=A0A2H0U8S3_9BACT|nr:MAG: NAD-dependent malic enzyme [Candidatus Kaiserbacteria bacterium CG10_big_fil_rev_8_21_14_0_10_59_10]
MRSEHGKKSLDMHRKTRGQFRSAPAVVVRNRKELSLAYTPGIAAVSSYLAKKPHEARNYTMKGRTIAVVSDGSAVLGLGNVGPYAALPVMEGKTTLFKAFAGVDAVPLVLSTQDADEIVETVVRIAPAFGGINLEDIAAPKCFDIERKLIERLDIPVMHDDQHGTAIVVLAGLVNALKVVGKTLARIRIVIAGAGAAGAATAHMLRAAGARDIIVLDRKGIIGRKRKDLSPHKKELARFTNPSGLSGGLREALEGADVVIGVSGPGLLRAADIRRMAEGAIVFALANPVPEIMPEEARRGGAAVIATGRSDYPNQLNNSLAFPGVFRGALDHRVRRITQAMKVCVAKNLAALVKRPTAEKILPDMFDKRIVPAVARAMKG